VALMARKRSASFVGSPPRDVVTDASIYERWLSDAAGDMALVADLVTGANSTTPIDHTGAPLGCPIRVPLAAQHIDRSLILSGAGVTVDEDDFYIIAVPVFVRTGEAGVYRLTVSTKTPAGIDVFAEVRDGSWSLDYGPTPGLATVAQVSPGARNVSQETQHVWSIALGEGLQYLLVRRYCQFGDSDPDGRIIYWTLDHDRTYAGTSNGLEVQGSAVVGDIYPAPSTLTPSTVLDFHDEEIFESGPLNSWVLTYLNRKINAFWEYITGAKIPGNATYQNATTWNNNRASFTAEASLEFPICISALGAILSDSGKPSVDDYTDLTPSEGLLDWMMHPTAHSTTNVVVESQYLRLPNFATGSSALKCSVLIHTPNSTGDAANWRFRVRNGTTLSNSGTATPVQIGSSNFHVATVTAIPFDAGVDNALNLQLAHTSNGALTQEIDILGCCYYYDP
jgi:hypothetical protein